MQLVEQHVIRETDSRYAAIDRAAFASKNLYNAANYLVRQSFIHKGVYLNFAAIFHLIKDHEAYCALPRKGYYVVEVVYEREPVPAAANPSLCAGIDIGLNNLAALTSNTAGFVPRLVNGRPVKSIDQVYNKRKAELQHKLDTTGTSRQMERLTAHRTRQIDHYLHTASRRIIDLLVVEGIGTLVIGQNPLWKQEANMGKRNNQNFVSVPHARFIAMLIYKAELVGIQVRITEESYTSQASFFDADPLPVYGTADRVPAFSGRRVKRGLNRAANGRRINADVNSAYTALGKVLPDSFGQGIAGTAVCPVRLSVRTKRVA
jgi:putative transposase